MKKSRALLAAAFDGAEDLFGSHFTSIPVLTRLSKNIGTQNVLRFYGYLSTSWKQKNINGKKANASINKGTSKAQAHLYAAALKVMDQPTIDMVRDHKELVPKL